MPVNLCIDTAKGQYYLQLKGLAKANITAHKKEVLQIKLRVLFMTFNFYPLRKKAVSNKQKDVDKPRRRKRKAWFSSKTILRLIRSFRVKRFLLKLDTGNCITNAKLYPVFALLNYKGGHFDINFNNRNELQLLVQNRPIRIIKSFINL